MSAESPVNDHSEDEYPTPKVLPAVIANRGLIPDSWGILGRWRKRKAEDRRPASSG